MDYYLYLVNEKSEAPRIKIKQNYTARQSQDLKMQISWFEILGSS